MLSNLLRFTIALTLLATTVATSVAQDEERQQRRQRRSPNLVRQTMNQMRALELNEEQTEKIEAIVKAHAAKLTEAVQATNNILTREQRQARQQAQRKGREEGLTGADLRKAVEEATELSDEQKEKLAESQKKLRELRAAMNKEIVALLSPEQKEKFQSRRRIRNRDDDGDGGDGGDGDGGDGK